ncbi:MAG: type II toxin-antitoxin system RelE/ParE family toxin [bacterium]
MVEIRWTVEAENWLKEIFSYIAEDNPTAAKRVVEGIWEKAQMLKDYPQIGHLFRKEPDGEVRIILYGHYRIAYQIKAKNQIDILGVFHGALDIERYIS